MKNKILLIVAIVFTTNAFAQKNDSLKKHEITLGYGLCNVQRVFSLNNSTFKGVGTFHLKYDYFLNEKISIGATINYASLTENVQPYWFSLGGYSNRQAPSYDIHYRSISTNCRMNFHGYNKNGLDVYCGAGAGINFYQTTQDGHSTKQRLPGFEFSLGLKYQWADNSGFFTEIGLTKSLMQVGTFFKF